MLIGEPLDACWSAKGPIPDFRLDDGYYGMKTNLGIGPDGDTAFGTAAERGHQRQLSLRRRQEATASRHLSLDVSFFRVHCAALSQNALRCFSVSTTFNIICCDTDLWAIESGLALRTILVGRMC